MGFFVRFIKFLLLILVVTHAHAQEQLPAAFTYQGRAYQADGVTPLSGTAAFTVEIRSANGNCLLYEETHSGIDLTASNGFFALNIGDGTASSGLALNKLFNNIGIAKATLSGTCGGTYTPVSQDTRVLRISVDVGGGPIAIDDQYIYTVPQAIVAQSLNGFSYNQFVLSLTTAQRNALVAPAANTEIYNITTGAFNKYVGGVWTVDETVVATDGTTITGDGSASDPLIVNPAALSIASMTGTLPYSRLQTCANDEILKMNGASWNCEAESTTATVAVNAPITGDGSAGSHLDIAAGGIDTAELANSAVTTAKIGNDQVTAAKIANGAIDDLAQLAAMTCTANQIIKRNVGNTAWVCSADDDTTTNAAVQVDGVTIDGDGLILATALKVATGGIDTLQLASGAVTFAKLDVAAGCTAGKVMTINAGGNAWECDPPATSIPTTIKDADNDTKIQVEESADEDKIRFDTAGSERMVIDEVGRVGIGAAAVAAKLEVTSGAAQAIIVDAGVGGGVSAVQVSNSAAFGNAIVGSATSSGIGVSGFSSTGAGVSAYSNGGTGLTASSNATTSALIYSNSAANTDPTLIVRQQGAGTAHLIQAQTSGAVGVFTVASDGKTGIGGAPNATYMLDVNGAIEADEYYYTSDIRRKKNVETLHDALQKILNLRGVSFNWKHNDKPEVGLIAQEVEEIYPELVSTDSKGWKAVKYGNLVGPLIESTKELYGMCKMSEQQLQALSVRVNTHDRDIASLKQDLADKQKQIDYLLQELKAIKSKLPKQ